MSACVTYITRITQVTLKTVNNTLLIYNWWLCTALKSTALKRGEEQGSKSPFSLLSEPISPSSLLLISSSRSIQFNSLYSQLFFFSLLPTFSPYFSLLPTCFGPFLPPPCSVPPPFLNQSERRKCFTYIITRRVHLKRLAPQSHSQFIIYSQSVQIHKSFNSVF